MFNKSMEGNFISNRLDFMESIRNDIRTLKFFDTEKNTCLKVDNVNNILRASFQFIKENQNLGNGNIALTNILIKVFLLDNLDSIITDFKYALTEITGQVKETFASYVVISSKNSKNQEFEITISYEDIVYFGSSIIFDNFEGYVNIINSFPPICKSEWNESYDLLVRLAIILGKNAPNERDFVFILNRVLSRVIEAKEITILKNLLVIDEFFIIPITSLQGFSQIPNTD